LAVTDVREILTQAHLTTVDINNAHNITQGDTIMTLLDGQLQVLAT